MIKPLPDRLKLRFVRWVGGHAASVIAWAAEREHALNLTLYPPCPDCAMPEPECYCAERADEQRRMADIDAAAYSQGYMDARRSEAA